MHKGYTVSILPSSKTTERFRVDEVNHHLYHCNDVITNNKIDDVVDMYK